MTYAPEHVLDAYYSIALGAYGGFSLETQRFHAPAFKQNRGPVMVCGLRLHLQL